MKKEKDKNKPNILDWIALGLSIVTLIIAIIVLINT